jgi:hypothetical protein
MIQGEPICGSIQSIRRFGLSLHLLRHFPSGLLCSTIPRSLLRQPKQPTRLRQSQRPFRFAIPSGLLAKSEQPDRVRLGFSLQRCPIRRVLQF